MDIYQYAKEFNADYMDRDGNIYKVQEYNRARELGLPDIGIKVYDPDGKFLGYAQRRHI